MAALSFKRDNLKFGLLLGLLAPLLGFLIYYFYRFFPVFSIGEYIRALKFNKSLLTGISSISLVVNVVLFTIYTNSRRDKTGRGIFVMTLVYGIIVLLFKLIA